MILLALLSDRSRAFRIIDGDCIKKTFSAYVFCFPNLGHVMLSREVTFCFIICKHVQLDRATFETKRSRSYKRNVVYLLT